VIRFDDPEATMQFTTSHRLDYDEQLMTFFLNHKPVELTSGQFRLLYHLYNHAYEVCTRESCAEVLWERGYDPVLDDLALNRVISNLRGQLQKIAPNVELITTHRGIGYTLVLTA
jgi:two-component system catabolic regulation response regulator CreB